MLISNGAIMIHIYSTKIKDGKGGISTALVGYVEALEELNVAVKIHTTHDRGNKIISFIRSFFSAFSVQKGDICWFHVGPWFSMLRKFFIMVICKLKGGRVIVHFHSRKTHTYLNNILGYKAIQILYLISERFVVLTPWWRKQFILHGFSDDVIVSPNPIDNQLLKVILSEKSSDNKKKHIHTNEIIVLIMGRLVEDKGFEQTIHAFTKLPSNYHLLVAGAGPLDSVLKTMVADYNLDDRVTFLGWVDYKDKFNLLSGVDIFCLPSKFDSFGMVYLEALAVNIPVVALNYQAIPDVVPEVYGVLCDNDNPEALANAIISAHELGDINSKEYVRLHYSPELVTAQFLENIKNDT